MNKEYALRDLGEFRNGLNYSRHDVIQPIKIIGVSDFMDRMSPDYSSLSFVDMNLVSDDYLLQNEDIIFVRSNGNRELVGRTMLISNLNEKITFSGFCIRFRPTNIKANSLYLLYYLKSPDTKKLFQNSRQSNINNINQETLGDIILNLPDLSEQNRIAGLLSSIDKKIDINNYTTIELENISRTLYDYWFTQFDFPDENGKPYRSSGGAMVWNEDLKREIPKDWKVKTIRQCVEKISTGLNPRKNFVLGNGGHRYVTIKNIENGQLNFSKCDFVDDNALAKIHARSDISIGDILFTSIEPIGRIYLIQDQPIDWDINESVFSIRANESIVSKEYLYATFNSDYFRLRTAPLKTGSVQKGIRIGALETMKIILPDAEIMQKFTDIIATVFKNMGLREQENNDLVELRDFLLPLLMNGQVKVQANSELKKEQNLSKQQSTFKRLVVSAYILDNICDEPTAGRVKFEKLLFLSEYCAQIDLGSNFQRYAAGPYDPQALYAVEHQLNKNKWFGKNPDKSQSNAYARLEKSKEYKPYVETNITPEEKKTIDNLLHTFKSSRTIECEIIATLYGAWNDFLIEGTQPTDKQIVDEVLTNWHEQKERICRKRWIEKLDWMKVNNFIPVGYGVSTKANHNE